MTPQPTTVDRFEDLLGRLAEACREIYSERLVAMNLTLTLAQAYLEKATKDLEIRTPPDASRVHHP